MLTVNELFSGIGSQSAALKRLGIDFKVVGIAEIDKYAIASYEAIHGKIHNYGDISKIDKLDYADFWTYSFPCQDLSVAGKGKGMIHICNDCSHEWEITFEDAICPNCYSKNIKTSRSGLLKEVERLLERSVSLGESPKYLMLENVKNLVGKANKGLFNTWLKRLEQLGYNTYWQVLNAKDYGVPQNRERVFAISIRKDIDTGYVFPKPFELKIRLKDILEKEVDEKYFISNDKSIKLIEMLIQGNQLKNDIEIVDGCINDPKSKEISNCIKARYDAGISNFKSDGTMVVESKRLGGLYDDETKHQAGSVWDTEGLAPTIDTMQGGNRQPCIVELNKVGQISSDGSQYESVYHENGLMPTLVAGCHGYANSHIVISEPYIAASRGRNPENPSDRTIGAPTKQRLEINKQGISNTITTVQKDNYVLEPNTLIPFVNKKYKEFIDKNGYLPDMFNPYNCAEIKDLAPTQLAQGDSVTKSSTVLINNNYRIRKLTPLECWRLMGFTDEDFRKAEKVNSNSQLYKQAGNSIVVDVLFYIFENLFLDKPNLDDVIKHVRLEDQLTIDDWLGGAK